MQHPLDVRPIECSCQGFQGCKGDRIDDLDLLSSVRDLNEAELLCRTRHFKFGVDIESGGTSKFARRLLQLSSCRDMDESRSAHLPILRPLTSMPQALPAAHPGKSHKT